MSRSITNLVKPTTLSQPKKPPVPTPNPRRVASTNRPDSSRLSREAGKKEAEVSAGTQNLLKGLEGWAPGTPETSKVDPSSAVQSSGKTKQTAPLSLDEGQFLRKGASGDKVTQLQELLNSKGAKLDVDGKFGPKTLSALKKFQGDNELGADGVVGPKTLEKLNGTGGADAGKAEEAPKVGADGKTEQAAETDKTDTTSGKQRFGDTRAALDKLPKNLKKYADVFQKAGEKYGVDPRFLAAISMHETGNGTSSAFRNKNNAMGISNRKGPIRMSSVEASINKMAQTLAKPDGYYRGKTTIGQIGKVYAPVGAANDPTGLNGYWAKGVAKNFKMFGGSPTGQVIFRNMT